VARYLLRYLGQSILLASGDFVLGRAPDCGLPLDDAQVSRRHAILHVSPDALRVEDLGSRNGIFINGERATGTSELGHGDVLSIGKQEIQIIEEEERQRRSAMATVPTADESDTLQAELRARAKANTDAPPPEVLSPREREVLGQLALGHTNKEVAAALNVSVKTVETHRTRIGDKLGLKTRAELVKYALAHDLMD